MIANGISYYEKALSVLSEPDPIKKVELTRADDSLTLFMPNKGSQTTPPRRPNRPKKPEILPPRDMPRRSTGEKGRVALVHALAHIELNAIDLAWDIILRFGPAIEEQQFLIDWAEVAKDEALHFQMLSERLNDLGFSYGDLPAHDGLWEAAQKTSGNVLDRLAIIPMMLEARGIDTTPAAVTRLKSAGDVKTASILEQIYIDEINHLKTGVSWFEHFCSQKNLDPVPTWKSLVIEHLNTKPKGPFNSDGRMLAGMSPAYWKAWDEIEI